MPKLKEVISTAKHEAVFNEIIESLRKNDLSAIEMLAITANMVGKLIAYQDHRTVTPDHAMQIVLANIELGNAQALRMITTETAGNA